MGDRDEPGPVAVDAQVCAGGDSPRVDRRVDPARLLRLEGRDLGEVEDVAHVDAVSRDLDAAEGVDREVAQWMRIRAGNQCERAGCRDYEDESELLHAAHRFAAGVQSKEKCGFRASALPNHAFATASCPRQRSI